jgi:hypothetical protein
MLNALRPFLLLTALAVVVPVQADAQQRGGQREDAGDRVRQVERDGGRVLQAQPMQRGGEEVYRLKVLTPEGRVRVIQGDLQDRPRRELGAPRDRLRDAGARPVGSAELARDREERARQRRAARQGNDPGGN